MILIGIIIGLFIGTTLGVVIAGLCAAAGKEVEVSELKGRPLLPCGYSTAMMYNKTFRLSKRWIRGNPEKQVIEESSDRQEWTQAEEVIDEKKELE